MKRVFALLAVLLLVLGVSTVPSHAQPIGYGYVEVSYNLDGEFRVASTDDSMQVITGGPVCGPGYPCYNDDTAELLAAVVPEEDTIKTYVELRGDGSFTGPLGFYEAAYGGAMGYTASLYYIDPGTSGYSIGDQVELDFGIQMEGDISSDFDPAWGATNTYYSLLNVSLVNDPDRLSSSIYEYDKDLYRPYNYGEMWGAGGPRDPYIYDSNGDIIGGSVVFGSVGDPWSKPAPPLDQPVSLSWQVNNYPLHVGDYLLFEDFSYISTSIDLSSFAVFPADNLSILDFGDSAGFSLSLSSSYASSGLQIVKTSLPGGNLSLPAPIPEPSTMLLLGTGLAGLIGFRKRLKANTS